MGIGSGKPGIGGNLKRCIMFFWLPWETLGLRHRDPSITLQYLAQHDIITVQPQFAEAAVAGKQGNSWAGKKTWRVGAGEREPTRVWAALERSWYGDAERRPLRH